MDLELLRLFQRINELGSLSAAARDTGLSKTTVSERLATLEAEMGTTLLNRSTRSLSLTDAGRSLLEGSADLLEQADNLMASVRHGADSLSGEIRISAPSDLGRTLISEAIGAFQAEHPLVTIELHLSDGNVDIVGEGVNLAIRYGDIPDRSWKMRRLTSARRILCAAPSYVEAHGTPDSFDALADHRCLVMRFGPALDRQWVFGSGRKKRSVLIDPYRIANDGHIVRLWCVDGHGIALKSDLDVREDLAAGRLVHLLPKEEGPEYALQLLYPPARARPARVQALAEFLSARFRKIHQSAH